MPKIEPNLECQTCSWELGEKRENTKIWEFCDLSVLQIPVLQDNYSYLLFDKSGKCIAIDPADDPKILRELRLRSLSLTAIWNTHWHHDHVGGNRVLLESAGQDLEVLGFSKERIPELTREVKHGNLPSGLSETLGFRVYEVPGHTGDHLAFAYGDLFVFSGDALFSLGCGRLFEGTAEQLLAVAETFLQFPEHTLLFCAHEYTRANLRFALSLEPENSDLQNFTPKQNYATVPSNLGFERRANPFLRLHQAKFQAAMAQKLRQWTAWSPAEQMAYIRKAKNHF